MSDLFTATTASEVEERLARGDNLEEERGDRWDNRETPLISSIKRRNKEVFLSLLQHGADPKHEPEGSSSPIQWAASEGWRDMVEALVKAGADVNGNSGNKGKSPLFLAIEKGFVDVVVTLLDLDVEFDGMGMVGTPLMMACARGRIEIADLLLAKGAAVNALSVWQESPLILAARGKHVAIMDQLVIRGALINQQDVEGMTALVAAAHEGSDEVVDRLLGLGCDANLLSKGNRSPLMWASLQGHPSTVSLLLAHGVDTSIRNKKGQTALDLAKTQEIRDLLLEHESKKQTSKEPEEKRHRTE